ncbi:uncharacterized protein LOC117291500 [Asterias rubens]|uniref:uncharacterized protein LOC117291500 n=1 Tax=Asterias rubens TaxID=7604 RepID=UPI001454F852|nr:uncharacterized protein LOC117291500 [Asterias rubens]
MSKRKSRKPNISASEISIPSKTTTFSDETDDFAHRQSFRKGGSSRPGSGPTAVPTDWRIGVIMAVCLPLSLLVLWYITLPLIGWILSSIIGSGLTQKLGFFKQDILTRMTSECPLWIAAEDRAFLEDKSHEDILRVSDVSQENLEEIVRRGEPVIVTDALRDWEAFGLYNCGYFMRKFPGAKYFDWQGQEYVSFGNITKRSPFTGLQCASGYMDTSVESNKKYFKEWLTKMPTPYFLKENSYILRPNGLNDEPAVTGFIGVPGTGVTPHLDETCNTIMTVQLSGVKNWSMSWPVKENGRIRWRKPIVFTLYPGEAMFWYVAMRHHTEVIDDCSLSFSFLLNTPAPRDYLKKLVQDLSSVSREERDALFLETGTSKVDYIDSCGIVEDKGTDFINS